MTDKPISTDKMLDLLESLHRHQEAPLTPLGEEHFKAAVARIIEYDLSEKAWDIKQRQLEKMTAERDALKAEVERLKEQLKNTETWWRNAQSYAARLLKQRDGLYGPLAQWKARAAKGGKR